MVMTLDDLKKLPPLTEDERNIIEKAKPTPTDDCPAMTTEELKEFKPYRGKKTVTINKGSYGIEPGNLGISFNGRYSEDSDKFGASIKNVKI